MGSTSLKPGRVLKVNAAGQILVEALLLMAIFLILVGSIARQIPFTFSSASPYLAGKMEQRLQTGGGFSAGAWQGPVNPKGGVKD